MQLLRTAASPGPDLLSPVTAPISDRQAGLFDGCSPALKNMSDDPAVQATPAIGHRPQDFAYGGLPVAAFSLHPADVQLFGSPLELLSDDGICNDAVTPAVTRPAAIDSRSFGSAIAAGIGQTPAAVDSRPFGSAIRACSTATPAAAPSVAPIGFGSAIAVHRDPAAAPGHAAKAAGQKTVGGIPLVVILPAVEPVTPRPSGGWIVAKPASDVGFRHRLARRTVASPVSSAIEMQPMRRHINLQTPAPKPPATRPASAYASPVDVRSPTPYQRVLEHLSKGRYHSPGLDPFSPLGGLSPAAGSSAGESFSGSESSPAPGGAACVTAYQKMLQHLCEGNYHSPGYTAQGVAGPSPFAAGKAPPAAAASLPQADGKELAPTPSEIPITALWTKYIKAASLHFFVLHCIASQFPAVLLGSIRPNLHTLTCLMSRSVLVLQH